MRAGCWSSPDLAGPSRICRVRARSVKKSHERNRVEMIHARFNDFPVLQPVDADDRQVDTLSVRCAGAQTPEHDDAIGNGQEFGFELSAVLGLVAIPGCPKSFGVTQHSFQPTVLAVIGQARGFTDENVGMEGAEVCSSIPTRHGLEELTNGYQDLRVAQVTFCPTDYIPTRASPIATESHAQPK